MALAADRDVRHQGEGILTGYPVEEATTIYKGAIVAVNDAGYAIPAADTAATRVVGIADEKSDNSAGADGATKVRVRSGAIFLLPATSITQAMVNDAMVVVDDETVDDAAGATNDIEVGKLVKFESTTSGWVYIPPTGAGL